MKSTYCTVTLTDEQAPGYIPHPIGSGTHGGSQSLNWSGQPQGSSTVGIWICLTVSILELQAIKGL